MSRHRRQQRKRAISQAVTATLLDFESVSGSRERALVAAVEAAWWEDQA